MPSVDWGVFFFLGFLSLLVQVLLVRQLLSVFSGNELEIGIALGTWLMAFGLGSIAGRRSERGGTPLAISLVTTALLIQPSVFLLKGTRLFLGLGPGEIIPLAGTVLVTSAAMIPLGFILGLQYPFAVRIATGRGRYAAGRVYVPEALGAMAAGFTFTFGLATRVDGVLLAALLSSLYLLLAAVVFRRGIVMVLLAVPLLLHVGAGDTVRQWSWPAFDLVGTAESRYGEVAVLRAANQHVAYEAGHPAFSLADAQTEELSVHTAMTLHPDPRRVLAVGGSPGFLAELLKYPDVRVDAVQENRVLWDLVETVLTPERRSSLASGNLGLRYGDGRRHLKRVDPGTYDLILLGVPPPSTAATNRFFTVEFFNEARAALATGGILILHGIPSYGYSGSAARRVNGAIMGSLVAVFHNVQIGSRESGLFAASDIPIEIGPALLRKRFVERSIPTTSFTPHLFDDIFPSVEFTTRRDELIRESSVNTDHRPVAYLFMLEYWADVRGLRGLPSRAGGTPTVLFAVLGGAALFGIGYARRRFSRAVGLSVFSTGFAGMGISIVVLLSFQARFGYVYEGIALLTAAFMAGAALGASLPARMSPDGGPIGFRGGVTALDGALGLLLVLTPLGLGHPATFYLVNAAAGCITGGQFGLANRALSEDGSSSRIAGGLYGIDLLGACLGSFVTAVLVIPLVGTWMTALFCAGLKTVSLSTLLLSGRDGTRFAR